jgi:hypothetical protein
MVNIVSLDTTLTFGCQVCIVVMVTIVNFDHFATSDMVTVFTKVVIIAETKQKQIARTCYNGTNKK